MCHEKSGGDYVADVQKLRYFKIWSAEVYTMKIRNLEPDPKSSDEEIEEEYISLNSPLATLVYAGKSNQAKQREVSEKESIQ